MVKCEMKNWEWGLWASKLGDSSTGRQRHPTRKRPPNCHFFAESNTWNHTSFI